MPGRNSSLEWDTDSNPTYAQGAIANVARIALMTPAVPLCAYASISDVTAFASFAAFGWILLYTI